MGGREVSHDTCEDTIAALKESLRQVDVINEQLKAKLDGYQNFTLPNGESYDASELCIKLLDERRTVI